MKKIAWITDSTCGLDPEYAKKNNIYIVPLHVIINGKAFKEDIDLTKEEFYDMLKANNDEAKTSQPSYGEFVSLYEELQKEYDYGIAVHASSELTGTYQSSASAAKMADFHVEVIDSKIGDFALGKMIQNGVDMFEEGKSYQAIIDKLRTYPEKAQMYLMPQSFEQLKQSGRVSTTQSLFASLLNIHLILGFDTGKVVVKEKVRNKKRARRKMFELLEEAMNNHHLKEICISHAGVKEQALAWKEDAEKLYSGLKIHIQTLVPVAGVHTGHGTMCFSWLSD